MKKKPNMSHLNLTAHLEFWSRGQVRGGYQWSTKRTIGKLNSLGYVCTSPYEGTLIQRVVLTGTRDDIIHQRFQITSTLKMMSGGKIPIHFQLIRRSHD